MQTHLFTDITSVALDYLPWRIPSGRFQRKSVMTWKSSLELNRSNSMRLVSSASIQVDPRTVLDHRSTTFRPAAPPLRPAAPAIRPASPPPATARFRVWKRSATVRYLRRPHWKANNSSTRVSAFRSGENSSTISAPTRRDGSVRVFPYLSGFSRRQVGGALSSTS